jgi:ubiquinone/menaquinone biosynthesis C-methylase UbiE
MLSLSKSSLVTRVCCSLILASLIHSLDALSQAVDPWKNIYSESAWSARDEWQKPIELIELLKIKKNSVVADIGSHEGYMTYKLSKIVGDSGKVYAVENRIPMVGLMQLKVKEKGIINIKPVFAPGNYLGLPYDSLDAIIILDTYHEVIEYESLLKNIKNSLVKGGRLVICEPIADERKALSRSEQAKKHEIAIEFVLQDLAKAGYKVMIKKENFIDREKIKGDKMWVISAVKD